MPTPGAGALQAAIGTVAIPLPGYPGVTIANNSETITRMAIGMDAGWIALYPTTSSTCETAIEAAFDNFIAAGAASRCWLKAFGKGIDSEMMAWVASWNPVTLLHSYTPTVDTIYNSIITEITACGYINAHTYPLASAVAGAWMAYFGQETG